MDVRGPVDGRDAANNVSQTRRELLRHELVDASHPNSNESHFVANATTPEIFQLTQQLRAHPEVRGELIAEATQKLREGIYFTRESAEKTAEAVLRTLIEL